MEQTTDVVVTREGLSMFTFELCTEAAKQWVDENVTDPMFMGSTVLVVDHRYARPLADGMMESGLRVE